ncbi:DUF2065 domain-containing protein [Agrilutibacter solisilvae]|uniref:DUF2065 family protein n=1 Tax=Agrilutibacter solisilvae TaxID=2763317 RepID=A0A974Y3E0_9GAMM|nr:DUF2065 family protein [Lysobacter solisilvae]QSX77056.1 DUF2065 family protein [Lysobacter solisilvae]
MVRELLSAICLVAVLEGLVLFVAPGGWKRAVQQLMQLSDRGVRLVGSLFVVAGLISLYLVRST